MRLSEERSPWTRTVPGMESFDDWQPIDTAPRNGTKFQATSSGTGNVYVTWYEPRWGSAVEVAEGDVSKAIIWWCEDERNPGRVTSFAPTHWRLP